MKKLEKNKGLKNTSKKSGTGKKKLSSLSCQKYQAPDLHNSKKKMEIENRKGKKRRL